MEHIKFLGRDIPVVADVDLFVAGGGCAGVGASIAAARAGIKTLTAERLFCLGGTLTSGLMSKIAILETNHGICEELIKRMDAIQKTNFLDSRHEVPVDPELSKLMLDKMLIEEASAEVFFGTTITDVIKDGRNIQAVVIDSINGLEAVRAKYFVDCTGDGQLGFKAGASFKIGNDQGYSSSPTLNFRVGNVDLEKLIAAMESRPELCASIKTTYSNHRISPAQNRDNIAHNRYAHFADFVPYIRQKCEENPGMFSDWELEMMLQRGILFMNQPQPDHVLVNCTRIPLFRGDDKRELSAALVSGRKQAAAVFRFMKTFLPGFENSFLMDTAAMLGIRESRRISGDYIFTEQDVESFKKFDDVIVSNSGGVEIHAVDGKETDIRELRKGDCYHVPYRSIIAKDFDNLFMAGRCFSASHPALSAARNISYCMALGQAAGNAAALLVKDGKKNTREVDIKALREKQRSVI